MLKRFISALTGFTLAFSMLGCIPVSAEQTGTGSFSVPSTETNNDLSFETTNTLGEMVAEKLENNISEEDAFYNVTGVIVDGNNAKVSYYAQKACTIVVGLYDETSGTMLDNGTVDAKSGSNSATVSFDSMPEYYLIKVFMIESASLRPLCKAYTNKEHTKKMHDFLALTTDDFNNKNVLNFDDDMTNNFMVFNDDVILIDDSDGEIVCNKNTDDSSKTYTIKNASDRIMALKAGDIISNGNLDDIFVIKVGSISADDNNITITAADTELEDVFSIVKIDVDTTDTEPVVGNIDPDSGLTFIGKNVEISPIPDEYNGTGKLWNFDNEFETDSQNLNGLKYDVGTGVSFSYFYDSVHDKSEEEYDDGLSFKTKVSGNLTFSADISVKVYVDSHDDWDFVRATLTGSADANLTMNLTASARLKIKLNEIVFPIMTGIAAKIKPTIILQGEATVSLHLVFSFSLGFEYDGGTPHDISEPPSLETKIQAKLSLFISLELNPCVSFLNDVADVNLTVTPGFYLYNVSYKGVSTYSRHECRECITTDVSFKFDIGLSVQFFGKEFSKLTFNIFSYECFLFKWYYSLTFDESGKGDCPHIQNKCIVHFMDEDGGRLSNATINVRELNSGRLIIKNQQLNDKGVADLWLPKGSFEITAKMKNAYFLPDYYDNYDDHRSVVIMKYDRFRMQDNDSSSQKPSDDSSSIADDDSSSNPKDDSSSRPNDDSSSKVEITPKVEEIPQPKETFDYKKGDNIRLIEGDGQYSPSSTLGFIDDNDTLFLWGYGEALSLGENDPDRNNYKAYKYYSITNVKKACVGREYIGYLTNEGELYLIGGSKSTNKYYYNIDEEYAMFKVTDHVKDFSIGSTNMAYIKDNGDLFTTGEGQYTNYKNSFLASNVEKVECGYYGDVAFITKNKDLFMWGTNASHNISDDDVKNYTIPEKVASNVKYVSAGIFNTYYVTETGDLHARGSNQNGETGREVGSGYSDKIIMTNVDKAYITIGKSLILDNNGDLYSCGINPLNPSENNYSPYKITGNVKSMYINNQGNYMYLSNDGTIYLFGWNSGGIYNRKNHKEMGNKYDTIYDIDTLYASLGTIETDTQNTNADVSDTDPFADLLPDCIYNVYGFVSDEHNLTNDDLAYIDQFRTDADGILPFDTENVANGDKLFWLAVPMTQTSIESAEVEIEDLVYNGEEQQVIPKVTLNGNVLTAGQDYYLSGDYLVTDAGEYTITVYGTNLYCGKVSVTFTVSEGSKIVLGDVNGDSKINITDITLVAAHVKGKRILSDEKQKAADVNKDGKINITDITKIAAHVKGKKLLTA